MPAVSSARLLVAVLTLSLVSCGVGPGTGSSSGDAADAGPTGDPIVSFGNAGPSETHVETPDNAPVDVIFGVQGGWHVWGSVRIQNMDPQGMYARYELTANNAVAGDSSGRNMPLRQVSPGVYEAVGLTMFLADGVDPRGWADDTPLHVKATFRDRRNKEVVVERDWLATCCETQR
ncbi:MAG: hypothetical protein AB2A00_13245 [Myxococcota bacterium]